ncbi:DJ-1/PfpI family protein [Actinomycetes bacterium KLBMP 9759]
MARVLVLAGDAAEELDCMYPVFRLREGGHAAVVAAPSRRPVKLVVHDFEPGWDAYTEKPGHQLAVDLAFADVRPEDYHALVIPGGRAPEYIRADPHVARIVHHFFEHDLPVGTICHGPQVPAAFGLLRDRRTAGYPPLRADLEFAGATFVDGPDVVDGSMVSCRGWPDLPEWSRAFMRVLEAATASA